MKRRYNYLKEKVTGFIDDDDNNVELKVPDDFPERTDEGAYQAYIDACCDGHEEWWNAGDFDYRYCGFYDSMEEFVEIQFLSWGVDKDTYVCLDEDPFFDCVDLYAFGRDIYLHYESELETLFSEEDEDTDASEFIGDYDEVINPKEHFSEREKAILQGIGDSMSDEWDYEGAAVGYIEAISKFDKISFRDVILNLENSSKYIDFKEGIDCFFGYNGDFVYEKGYVFFIG